MPQRHVRTILGTLALFLAAMHAARAGTGERVEARGLGMSEPHRLEVTGTARVGSPLRKHAARSAQDGEVCVHLAPGAPPAPETAQTRAEYKLERFTQRPSLARPWLFEGVTAGVGCMALPAMVVAQAWHAHGKEVALAHMAFGRLLARGP